MGREAVATTRAVHLATELAGDRSTLAIMRSGTDTIHRYVGHQKSKTVKRRRCMNGCKVVCGEWYGAILKFVATDFVLLILCICSVYFTAN